MLKLNTIIITAFFIAMSMAQAQAGDAARGEKVFSVCRACHFADKELNKVGPSLFGVVGRQAGSFKKYKKYSDAMKAAGESGLVWDEENLTVFLRKPRAFIKGTKMPFAGFKDDAKIADVIAYLKQFSK